MLKNLTILALAGALLPACIITSGDTATDTLTSETTAGTTAGEGTTVGTTAEGTTVSSESATTAATDSGTTADVPTTGEPTTGEPTTDGTTAGTTTAGTTTTDSTTGGALYGMCGWVAEQNYYGCVDEGADPGVEDPAGIDPIACGDGVVEGADCTDKEGPVKNIGCCAENGDLFLCDTQGDNPTLKIIKVACGA